jgi:polar amino acid transport system substrate-binding protein
MIDLDDWRRCTVVAYLDEPPYFAPGPDGPVGCDIELARTVLADLGVEHVDFVLTTFDALMPGLRDRRWHLNVPMFITAERAESIRFSLPVWAANDGFVVRAGDRREVSSYEAIAADPTMRLAVVAGQIQQSTALRAGVRPEQIDQYPDQDAAARAVIEGRADASASTAPGNFAYVQRAADPRVVAVVDALAVERGGAALGAFSFEQSMLEFHAEFDAALTRYLGTPDHLAMMSRYGFTAMDLRPALRAAGLSCS